MKDHKASAKPPAPMVRVAVMAMALEKQKQKYEKRLAEKDDEIAALRNASGTIPETPVKQKRNGEPYNNVPGGKRDRRFQRQLDKVLSGVQSGKLRGKMHGEHEVIGQSTIRDYLKAYSLRCGSEHAGTFQQQLIKAGWCEMKNGKVVLKQQSRKLENAA